MEGLNKLQNSFSRHTQGQALHFWRRPESSQNNCLLDAGRFGLHVLGNCSCIALLLYIPVQISRHFLHPVDRIHQHDDKDT